jgi:ribosomal protein L37AE/L43A
VFQKNISSTQTTPKTYLGRAKNISRRTRASSGTKSTKKAAPMSTASNSADIFQDDFALPDAQEKKIKRSKWHKRKNTLSPEVVPELEKPENPAKRPKKEPTVKFENLPVAALAAVKIDRDRDADDAMMIEAGFNPLVHLPRCEECKAENAFQENDEGALVCTACAHVNSKSALLPGFDTPQISKNSARLEEKQVKREVRLEQTLRGVLCFARKACGV